MKENMHIEKELLFRNNIKDITSISLDSDYKVEEGKLVGNFILDGEYKIHELSINKEKFNFKIPFDYELDRNTKEDSVKVEITDFTYDYKQDELIVNIDYTILGDTDDVIEFDSKELLDDYLREKEVDLISEKIEDIKKLDEEPENVVIDIEDRDTNSSIIVEKSDIEDIKVESKKNDVDINDVVNKVSSEDSFVNYKVYTIKENESIESIIMKYHTTIDDLKEYNDLSNISIGDKIIIPSYE